MCTRRDRSSTPDGTCRSRPIYDNDNMRYIRPLDPGLGTLGTMIRAPATTPPTRASGTSPTSTARPTRPGLHPSTALEPYGFSECNNWGDIDGGTWAGLQARPGHRRPGRALAARPRTGRARRAAVVHRGQLRQPARRHELRLRQSLDRAPHHLTLSHAVPSSRRSTARVLGPLGPRPPRHRADDLPVRRRRCASTRVGQRQLRGHRPPPIRGGAGLNFYLNCLRDVDRSIDSCSTRSRRPARPTTPSSSSPPTTARWPARHGLRQKGNLVYDENFHVPLVIVAPRRRRRRRPPTRSARRSTSCPRLLDFAGSTKTRAASNPGLTATPCAGVARHPGARRRAHRGRVRDHPRRRLLARVRATPTPAPGCSRASCVPT